MSAREHSRSSPPTTQPSAAAPEENRTIRIDSEVDPVAFSRLCEQLRRMIERGGHDPVMCDVDALRIFDARTVDALARLQLTARRFGSSIVLLHAPAELVELLELTGLLEVLPTRTTEKTA